MKESRPKVSLQDTLKSMDTEETIDLWFYRPVGYRWALLFERLGVKPNAVTIASIFLGVAAGVLFYYNDLWLNVLGMFLLVWANSYDSADGQLARMTKQFSRIGRILDGVSGDLWFVTIYVAICLRMMHFEGWSGYIFVLAVVAGYFHATQASMADYYRNFHLYFLKGKSGSELDDTEQLTRNFKSLSWKRDFFRKLVLFFYRNYTKTQESFTPNMQRFRKVLKEKYGEEIPLEFRERFRAKSKPLMKYTNMLSFNTRVIALFIALFIDMPWLYFVFEITVLNIMLIYMVRRHENICKEFTLELTAK
ncbi:CDP-alcohol phosphatidyltransferase family protein [Barnesiella propionica]|uniref:CDP-alcohol phosphatidyltransferase family protein n=1 Tax=Barnesiella propionica TaxID=2981781 RepID=UPI0011CB3A27|nr:CDP-alcohol phosphatidyltransferase family protein [Barnesiella propionica]MCU6769264.1 CDP-alcohol phosphatidyltransferase family protein [Barnesiella propionica]